MGDKSKLYFIQWGKLAKRAFGKDASLVTLAVDGSRCPDGSYDMVLSKNSLLSPTTQNRKILIFGRKKSEWPFHGAVNHTPNRLSDQI